MNEREKMDNNEDKVRLVQRESENLRVKREMKKKKPTNDNNNKIRIEEKKKLFYVRNAKFGFVF